MSAYSDITRELTEPGRAEARLARLQEIEDQLFEAAAGIMQAHMAVGEVDPDQQEPPPDWVEKYGLAAARRRLVIAKLGYAPHAQMPSAVKLSAAYMTGVMRGRQYAAKQLGPRVLNVKIALPAPTSAEHPQPGQAEYPSKEIE